jgi:hypothetical protein
MRAMADWIIRPLQGLFAIFGLRVVRASAYQATIAKNQNLEAQIAGFLRVMEQDYRLIHDLFHENAALKVGD